MTHIRRRNAQFYFNFKSFPYKEVAKSDKEYQIILYTHIINAQFLEYEISVL